MALLRPLLLDNVPRFVSISLNALVEAFDISISFGRSIQQSAALALGRLANYSDDLAEAVVQNEILPQLVRHPSGQV